MHVHYKTLALVAAALLLATLAPLPRAADELVRIVTFGVGLYGVVLAVGEGRLLWAAALAAVALVFNPFVLFGMERSVWVGLAVASALTVGASAFRVGTFLD